MNVSYQGDKNRLFLARLGPITDGLTCSERDLPWKATAKSKYQATHLKMPATRRHFFWS